MEAEPNADEILDDELTTSLESYSATDLGELSISNQRLAKIDEYEERALARTDPFEAVIGMGSADLQRIFEYMSAAILAQLESQAPTLEGIREVAPVIRILVKVRTAIETDLPFQDADAGWQAANKARSKIGKGIGPKFAASTHDQLPKRWQPNV